MTVTTTQAAGPARIQAEYVLPLRWKDDTEIDDLTAYLLDLAKVVDVTVVDGSASPLLEEHHRAWGAHVRHIPPRPWPGRNGKVRGVMTGLRAARHPFVVLADDDVRHDPTTLARGIGLLEDADLVIPQNVFTSWPWHARWDTGRQLLNRAGPGDYPGTFFVRRDALAEHGYDGDVLFENLEMIRTIEDGGGVVVPAPSLFVGRRPPTSGHFRSQRVRRAYDDLAQPGRLVVEAAVLPVLLLLRHRRRPLAALALSAVLLGEYGRRREDGATAFPASAALWASVWALERAVCIWLALARRAAGGVPYGDGVIVRAATRSRSVPCTGPGVRTD